MRARKKSTRSVVDSTLLEAEEAHVADRPNADPYVRFAALTLDAMFFYLVYSASNGLATALSAHLANVPTTFLPHITTYVANHPIWISNHIFLLVNLGFFYLQTIFLVTHFGGSTAKILIGLRVVHLPSGRKLSLQEAMFREWFWRPLSLFTLGGAAATLFRKDRKAFHDLMTHSSVKRVHGAR